MFIERVSVGGLSLNNVYIVSYISKCVSFVKSKQIWKKVNKNKEIMQNMNNWYSHKTIENKQYVFENESTTLLYLYETIDKILLSILWNLWS